MDSIEGSEAIQIEEMDQHHFHHHHFQHHNHLDNTVTIRGKSYRQQQDEKRHSKKLFEVTSHSLEHTPEGKKLRKQAVVTSVSTGCLDNVSSDTMPKISVAMRSLNRSVHQLLKEDLDVRPGYRPPTPARQSLPNLLPVGVKLSNGDNVSKTSESWRNASTEFRRATMAGQPRSASPTTTLNQQAKKLAGSDVDLSASVRFDGWSHGGGGVGGGGVVHLPPITKGKQDLHHESRLTVAKKTLEQLETVLNADGSLVYVHSHSRPSVHTHT